MMCSDNSTSNRDEEMSYMFSGTLYEFVNGSRAVSEFLRSFGEADCIKPDLEFLAVFGSDHPQWLELRGGLVRLISSQEPVTYHPMKGGFDTPISGPCANAIGSALVGACCRGIFRDADFSSVLDSADSIRGVRRYVEEHFTKLRQRLLTLAANMNHAAWQEIADDMTVECEALVQVLGEILVDQSSGKTQ